MPYYFSGRKLREQRERRGFTREQLAVRADGLTAHAIESYETGKRIPYVHKLGRLCGALNITPNDLFTTRADRR